jgi:hypothetical protein
MASSSIWWYFSPWPPLAFPSPYHLCFHQWDLLVVLRLALGPVQFHDCNSSRDQEILHILYENGGIPKKPKASQPLVFSAFCPDPSQPSDYTTMLISRLLSWARLPPPGPLQLKPFLHLSCLASSSAIYQYHRRKITHLTQPLLSIFYRGANLTQVQLPHGKSSPDHSRERATYLYMWQSTRACM